MLNKISNEIYKKTVKKVPNINKKKINKFIFLNKTNSKIKSLEKKPDKKGNPDKDKLATLNIHKLKEKFLFIIPNPRISWLSWNLWIKIPAHINKRALKQAWVAKWKNVKSGKPKAKVDIINPNWLNVERAIIFFKSNSKTPLIPDIIIVKRAIVIKNIFILGLFKR